MTSTHHLSRRDAALDAWKQSLGEMPTVGQTSDDVEAVSLTDDGPSPAQKARAEDRVEDESKADREKTAEMLHRGRVVATYQPQAPVDSLAAAARHRRENVTKNRQVQRRSGSGAFGDLPHQALWKAQPIGDQTPGPRRRPRATVSTRPISGFAIAR